MADKHKTELYSLLMEITPSRSPARSWYIRAAARYRRMGISSLDDLLEAYPKFTRREKFVALNLFMRARFKEAMELVFSEFESEDNLIAGAASAAAGLMADRKAFLRIRRILERPRRREVFYRAIAALAVVHRKDLMQIAVQDLLKILERRPTDKEARALAVDSLTNLLADVDKRTKVFRKTKRVLIRCLSDRSPEVRASAAHAIGELRIREGRRKLAQLSKVDSGWVRGLGTVAKIAREALEKLAVRPTKRT